MYSSISQREYELMLNSIKDHAIFMLDTAGHIISWNEGARRIKGYEENEVLGKHFRMLFMEKDRDEQRPECEMTEALTRGKHEEDWWRLRKDGSRFWARVVLQPVFDDSGEHNGFVKITSDITEYRRINELNDFLMNEVTGYAIFLLDKEGKVAKWSRAAESIVGYKEEEVLGKSLGIVYVTDSTDKEQEVKQHLSAALVDRYEEEGWKVRKDGSQFWANYVVTPLYNQDGYVVMIRDLTGKRALEQHRKTHQALTANNKQLQRLEFISRHNLKEPVRKMATFCDMLVAESPKQQRLISKIVRSCSRLSRQLDEISELSLITENELSVNQDLNHILKNVIENLEEEIALKKAVIRFSPLPLAPVIPSQIEQLMENLIHNSMKFCPAGQAPEVNVEGTIIPKESIEEETLNLMRHANQYVQIRVEDNGIGFDQEHASQIFDLFKKLNGNAEFDGSGVGLTICKRIVDNHGGNIKAFAEEGKGSLFVVTLPLIEQ